MSDYAGALPWLCQLWGVLMLGVSNRFHSRSLRLRVNRLSVPRFHDPLAMPALADIGPYWGWELNTEQKKSKSEFYPWVLFCYPGNMVSLLRWLKDCLNLPVASLVVLRWNSVSPKLERARQGILLTVWWRSSRCSPHQCQHLIL